MSMTTHHHLAEEITRQRLARGEEPGPGYKAVVNICI